MTSTFVALPTEILGQIIQELNFHDLLSIRCLFNKTVHEKTFPYCASKLFRTLTTDLSLTNLKKLKELAGHAELARHVKMLRIAGDWEKFGTLGKGFLWQRAEKGHLEEPNPGTSCLRNIFLEDLTNCRSFLICPDWGHERHERVYSPDYLAPCDCLLFLCTIIAETGIPIHALHLSSDVMSKDGGK
jgi:hypothetical protein